MWVWISKWIIESMQFLYNINDVIGHTFHDTYKH